MNVQARWATANDHSECPPSLPCGLVTEAIADLLNFDDLLTSDQVEILFRTCHHGCPSDVYFGVSWRDVDKLIASHPNVPANFVRVYQTRYPIWEDPNLSHVPAVHARLVANTSVPLRIALPIAEKSASRLDLVLLHRSDMTLSAALRILRDADPDFKRDMLLLFVQDSAPGWVTAEDRSRIVVEATLA